MLVLGLSDLQEQTKCKSDFSEQWYVSVASVFLLGMTKIKSFYFKFKVFVYMTR